MRKGVCVPLAAGACALVTAAASAQSTPYYLTSTDDHTVVVVQNGEVINRWKTGIYCSPIAVSNGTVRVADMNGGKEPGKGYDLKGTPMGDLVVRQGSFTLDSCSDGAHNYFSDGKGMLWGTGLDWVNPFPCFPIIGGLYAITYDAKRDSIWTSTKSVVYQYSMKTGQLVSTFETPQGDNCGLAYEPATDTLWMFTQFSNLLRQYRPDGTLIKHVGWSNTFSDNVIGGEFEIGKSGCLPDCDESGGLDVDDFICFQAAYLWHDPKADCNLSGDWDIDDYICFQSLFSGGCP